MLLSLAELRDHFETDLADAALQRLLDAAEEEIVTFAGPHASASDFFSRPLSRSIFLDRKAQSITTVTERVLSTDTVLDATDYRQVGARELVRDDQGPNPRASWGDEVTVAYVPVDDTDTRKRIQVDLVKLAAQYDASTQEGLGDFSVSAPEYQAERMKILRQLNRGLALA